MSHKQGVRYTSIEFTRSLEKNSFVILVNRGGTLIQVALTIDRPKQRTQSISNKT